MEPEKRPTERKNLYLVRGLQGHKERWKDDFLIPAGKRS